MENELDAGFRARLAEATKARDARIRQMVENGYTLREVASVFNFSHEYVRRICKQGGQGNDGTD